MGSPCLFTRQQALKMGYFYWLRVKSLNHLHTELNLGYLKGTKFCLESKASFIDIAVLLHLSRFWLPGCGIISFFRTVPWLIWCPRVGQNTPSWELFSKKNSCSTIKLFSSSNMFFIRLFLANTWKKIGGHRARLRKKENLFRYRA